LYVLPGVSVKNVADVPAIPVWFAGREPPSVVAMLTLYVDAPPTGAIQLTVICACAMDVNTPPMSVPERVTGFGRVNRPADAIDVEPFPLGLTDWTVNVYDVFGLRPVNMYGYVADVCGDVATDGVDVKMLLVAPRANDATAIWICVVPPLAALRPVSVGCPGAGESVLAAVVAVVRSPVPDALTDEIVYV
jgi:hypothetical protein